MNSLKIMLVALILLGVGFVHKKYVLSNEKAFRVGVVAPMQHRAMDQITQGIKDHVSFEDEHDLPIRLDIQNAMGDKVLLRSILSKFISKRYDVILTIGTESTQLAAQMSPDIPVIGLDVSKKILGQRSNLTGVVESNKDLSLPFLKTLNPDLKKIAFVFSQNDKNFEYYELLKKRAQAEKVTIQPVIVETLSDLYSLEHKIDLDSDFIFISKDHIAASGASVIAKTAQKLQIPFISSDEGSVAAGASAALSNSEYAVGAYGAEMMKRIYQGESIKKIAPHELDQFTVFLNLQHALDQHLKIKEVKEAALLLHCQCELTREAS